MKKTSFIFFLVFVAATNSFADAIDFNASGVTYQSIDREGAYTRIINPVYRGSDGTDYPLANTENIMDGSNGPQNSQLCSLILNEPVSDFIAMGEGCDAGNLLPEAKYDSKTNQFSIIGANDDCWANEIYCLTTKPNYPTYQDRIILKGNTATIIGPRFLIHGKKYPISPYVQEEESRMCQIYGYTHFVGSTVVTGTTTEVVDSFSFFFMPDYYDGGQIDIEEGDSFIPIGTPDVPQVREIICSN